MPQVTSDSKLIERVIHHHHHFHVNPDCKEATDLLQAKIAEIASPKDLESVKVLIEKQLKEKKPVVLKMKNGRVSH